jgi:hypothetical protein
VDVEALNPEADSRPVHAEEAGQLWHGEALGGQQHQVRPLAHPADGLTHNALELDMFSLYGWSGIDHLAPPPISYHSDRARYFLLSTYSWFAHFEGGS